jgi:alpha-galactosidase
MSAASLLLQGWNSWNAYGCNINETSFLSAAQNIVDKGFKAAGYEYVNIDDCWSVKSGRDNTTGRISPNSTKFPEGISGLADNIHAMGLKIGIYSSAGTETCAGYPASIGYESIDAATFAAWGIDCLKYNNCNVPENWTDTCFACVPDSAFGPNGTCTDSNTNYCPAGYDYSQSNSAKRYGRMRDALLEQNRTILYSLCSWVTSQYGHGGMRLGIAGERLVISMASSNQTRHVQSQDTFDRNKHPKCAHPINQPNGLSKYL